jgi:hypothetical protein
MNTEVKVPVVTSLESELKNNADVRFVPVNQLISFLTSGALKECYECIPNATDIKPYFDLDIKKRDYPNSFNSLFQDKENILNKHLEYLRGEFSNPTFAISSCHRSDKISYHITINNHKTQMKHIYNLSRNFKNNNDFDNYFDTSVYNSDDNTKPRKFRTIFSSKGSETNEHLKPETFKEDNQLEQHFICNVYGNLPIYTYTGAIPVQQQEEEQVSTETIGDVMVNSPLVDYKDWLKIGISLLIVYDTNQARDEFLKFSKKHASFNLTNFNKIWKSLLDKDYKKGGWNLLKKYVPIMYHKQFITDCPLPMDNNDYDIATYILNTFDKFSITTFWGNESNANSKQWFCFINHRWKKEQEVKLRKILIYEHLYQKYNAFIKAKKGALNIETDEDKRAKMEEELKSVKKLLSSIKSVKKCCTIMEAIFGECHRADFREKLDQDPYLFGFNNGVYDLNKNEFRAGVEDDYVSLSAGYDYSPEYDENKMQKLIKVLMNICCDKKDLYDCLLTKLARHLKGDNSTTTQLFHCWYGKGSNGKSTISNLLELVLGEYFTRLPSSFLSQKMQRSDGTTNDIAKLVGRRIVVMSETEENMPVNIATLKNFSGEKKVPYRANFESMRETRITWTLILQTNEKVQLPLNDYGTLRRFRYFPFQAKFVDDDLSNYNDTDDKMHYNKDEELAEMIDGGEFKLEVINLLFQYLNKPLEFPQWIKDITLDMIKSQDKLLSILEQVVEEADENYGLTRMELKMLMKKEKLFHKLSYNSDTQLFDNVIERLKYIKVYKNNNTREYISTLNGFDERRKSRSLFLCIRQRTDTEEDGEDCVL